MLNNFSSLLQDLMDGKFDNVANSIVELAESDSLLYKVALIDLKLHPKQEQFKFDFRGVV